MTSDPDLTHDVALDVAEAIRLKSPVRTADVAADTRLVDDLGLDSLRVLELLIDFEDRYGLAPFAEGELMGVTTVGALVATVLGRVRRTRQAGA